MRKMFVLLVSFMLIVGFSAPTFAQNRDNTKVTVDLKELDDFTRNKVIEMIKKSESTGVPISLGDLKPLEIKTWANAITETIKDVCHNLNVEVNEFIRTPAGMLITGLIVYRVIGKDLLIGVKDIVFTIIGWTVCLLIIYLFVARKFLLPRKIKTEKTYEDKVKGKVKEVTYAFVQPYDFISKDSKTAAYAITVIISVILTFVAMVIIL